jgi:phosphohistidine phosphatase SixA
MSDDRRAAVPVAGVLLLASVVLAFASPTAADEAVWSLLKGGGHIVLIRHAITTPGVGDPPGMRLDDCRTQRNLTEEGRRHAQRVGEAVRARGVRVERVRSSPWCRCLETARLAFGPAETWTALSNLFGRPEQRAEQVRQMQAAAGERRDGGNVIWVTHGSTIAALTGINPDTAEMVVLTPRGDGRFAVAGRLVVP